MKGIDGFHGERLTQAREARGLTKTTLGKMIGISLTAVSDLEAGRSQPKQETLDAICASTSFSSAFFARPPKEGLNGPVFWRRLTSDAVRSQAKTRQRIDWAAEAFSVLEDVLDFPQLRLPRLASWPGHWSEIRAEHIEELAEECRADWGIGEYPIPDMTLALENIGIPVLAFEIENEKQSGYSKWVELINRPIIGANTLGTSGTRHRFNLAHELGHMLMHLDAVPENELRNPQYSKAIEAQAHRFAGALLFPRAAFLREVRYPSLEEFASHKQEWGMSIVAQIVRARDLGLCDHEWYQSLIVSASKRGFRGKKGEPFDNFMPVEKPRMLPRAIEALEEANELLLLARVKHALALPGPEELEIFGRRLEPSGSNVVQLKKPL